MYLWWSLCTLYLPACQVRVAGMPGESYRRWHWSLLLYSCDVFWVLINSLVCWFCHLSLPDTGGEERVWYMIWLILNSGWSFLTLEVRKGFGTLSNLPFDSSWSFLIQEVRKGFGTLSNLPFASSWSFLIQEVRKGFGTLSNLFLVLSYTGGEEMVCIWSVHKRHAWPTKPTCWGHNWSNPGHPTETVQQSQDPLVSGRQWTGLAVSTLCVFVEGRGGGG